MALSVLPAELKYGLLPYLDIESLHSISQVSRVWHDVVYSKTRLSSSRRKLLQFYTRVLHSPLQTKILQGPKLERSPRPHNLGAAITAARPASEEVRLWTEEWPSSMLFSNEFPSLDLGKVHNPNTAAHYSHWWTHIHGSSPRVCCGLLKGVPPNHELETDPIETPLARGGEPVEKDDKKLITIKFECLELNDGPHGVSCIYIASGGGEYNGTVWQTDPLVWQAIYRLDALEDPQDSSHTQIPGTSHVVRGGKAFVRKPPVVANRKEVASRLGLESINLGTWLQYLHNELLQLEFYERQAQDFRDQPNRTSLPNSTVYYPCRTGNNLPFGDWNFGGLDPQSAVDSSTISGTNSPSEDELILPPVAGRGS